jgi:hypothetical protein
VRPVGGVDVGDAVGVDIADHRDEHPAEARAELVRIDDEPRYSRQAIVDMTRPPPSPASGALTTR